MLSCLDQCDRNAHFYWSKVDSVFLILECIGSEDLVPYGSSALHVLYNYLFSYFFLYLLTLENLCNYIFLLCCDR